MSRSIQQAEVTPCHPKNYLGGFPHMVYSTKVPGRRKQRHIDMRVRRNGAPIGENVPFGQKLSICIMGALTDYGWLLR
jgi:hypothetical protein